MIKYYKKAKMRVKEVKNMGAKIRDKRNVKIFVLYLMQNINYPLDYVTINDIVMQNDYVLYLDFAESFHEMLDSGLVTEDCKSEDGDPLYVVSEKGMMVANELHSEILTSLLDKSLECALRYLNFKKRGIRATSHIEERRDGKFELVCMLKEKDVVLMENRMVVDTLNRAKRMEDNFHDRPEVVYRGVMALLSGNINFIFN